jgi:hypothetical protein
MFTFEIVLLISNIVLILLCLSLIYPKVIVYITQKKKLRERKAKQGKALEKAQFVKTIRTEVRKYLKELQN